MVTEMQRLEDAARMAMGDYPSLGAEAPASREGVAAVTMRLAAAALRAMRRPTS